jgi:hypothetical protein
MKIQKHHISEKISQNKVHSHHNNIFDTYLKLNRGQIFLLLMKHKSIFQIL